MAVNIDELNLFLEYTNKLNRFYGIKKLHHETLIKHMELGMDVSIRQLKELHSYLENLNILISYFGVDTREIDQLFKRMELSIRLGQLSLLF